MAFCDAQNLPQETQIFRVQGRAMVVKPKLTWQYPPSEFHPKQTKAVCVNQIHLSLWASMTVSAIYVALNVTLCMSLLNY